MSWLDRAAARLLPAQRRDWAEAVWAEAHQVPAGWPRLAWRAGGAWMIVREALMARRIGSPVLFAAAAAAAAWAAWPPGSPVSHAGQARADIIVTVALLAGLPLLARRLLGPPGGRAGRWLRAGFYAAILAMMSAKAATALFVGAVPHGGINLHTFRAVVGDAVPGTASVGPDWLGEGFILFITFCYLAVILALTARRAPVQPSTLAVAAGAGLVQGLVVYAVQPLGLYRYATNPWLHGSAADPLVGLAWAALFGAPLVAGALAGRRCRVPDDLDKAAGIRAWQGLAAGLITNGAGALFVTVSGTGTTALMIRSALVRGWLYPGQHLTASAVYGRELLASQLVMGYGAVCIIFPIVGVMMAMCGAGYANVTASRPGGGPPRPPGPPGPEPAADPPAGGQLAGARS
jgi:hypothetical protein